MAENVINQICRQLYAMGKKKKEPDFIASSRDAKYQRTFTDEYPFAKKSRGRQPVPKEQREHWAMMDRRRG